MQAQVTRSRCHRDLTKVRARSLSPSPTPTLFKLQPTATRALLSSAPPAGASPSLHNFYRQQPLLGLVREGGLRAVAGVG